MVRFTPIPLSNNMISIQKTAGVIFGRPGTIDDRKKLTVFYNLLESIFQRLTKNDLLKRRWGTNKNITKLKGPEVNYHNRIERKDR